MTKKKRKTNKRKKLKAEPIQSPDDKKNYSEKREEGVNLPPVLYKFESFNTYSLSNLKNSQIYFNRPIDFNDPFDCSLVVESFRYGDEDIITLYNYWISNKLPNLPPASSSFG